MPRLSYASGFSTWPRNISRNPRPREILFPEFHLFPLPAKSSTVLISARLSIRLSTGGLQPADSRKPSNGIWHGLSASVPHRWLTRAHRPILLLSALLLR